MESFQNWKLEARKSYRIATSWNVQHVIALLEDNPMLTNNVDKDEKNILP